MNMMLIKKAALASAAAYLAIIAIDMVIERAGV